jgi:hypothetical protein
MAQCEITMPKTLLCLIMLLLSLPTLSQSELPAAPSPSCASNNTLVLKLAGCVQFQSEEQRMMRTPMARIQPVGFFTFRAPNDAPLRTTRNVLGSKTYIALNAAAFTAAIAACRNKRSGEDWGSEMPAVSVMAGFDFLMDRYISRSLSVAAPVYEMIHYGKNATK